MNGQWSLKELYLGYDTPEYQSDYTKLEETLNQLSNMELTDNLSTIKKVIDLLEIQSDLTRKLYAFSSLQLSTNTTHEPSLTAIAKLRKLLSNHAKTNARIDKFLGNIETDITQDEKLTQYQFLFAELKQQATHLLSDEVEEVIATMNLSAGQSWSQLQSFLTSTVETEFNGESLTLSDIRNLAYAEDSATRKAAYEAELAMYESIKEPVAFALNNIKSQVNDISRLRGYESALEVTLEQSRMSKATLDALIAAIKDALPSFQKYFKHKAGLLGYANGLPFYELFAPIGESVAKKFTVDEMKEYLVEHFNKFAPDLAELTTEVFDKEYVDLFPRKGKVGGAFCSNLTPIKQSRILMNFDGNLRNVVTMAHELGHAYHGSIIQEHLPLNRSYTMPVAETASTFNENIIMNTVIAEANDKEKIGLLESLISDVAQIVVDILSRYIFETTVFEKRQDSFLFSKDLEAIMLEAQDQSYGEGLDPEFRHPFMWLCKGHYYSTGLSYYNFPYAFGGLFAKGLYVQYQNDPTGFVEKYREMLYATTVGTVEETAAKMGIDVTTKDFWASALKEFENMIEEFIQLTSDTND